MRTMKALLSAGAAGMAATILYGMRRGSFREEARRMGPWWRVTLIDLYAGLALFVGWIAYRERSWPRSIVWTFLVLTLGNLATFIYALYASLTSRGDWRRFFLGRRIDAA